MRQFAMILLLLGSVFAVGTIKAQEEELIFLYLSCYTYDEDFHTRQGMEFLDGCPKIVLDTVNHELEQFNIFLEPVSLIPPPPDYEYDVPLIPAQPVFMFWYMNMLFDTNELYLSIIPNFPIQEPVLVLNLNESPAFFLLTDNYSLSLAAYITYSMSRCDLTEVYLELMRENNIEHSNWLEANCALLTENYTTAISLYELMVEQDSNNENGYRNPDLYGNLAWLYLQVGDSQAAFDISNDFMNYLDGIQGYRINYWYLSRIKILTVRAWLKAMNFDYDGAIDDIDNAILIAEELREQFQRDYNTTLAELYTIRGEIIFLIYEWDRVLENFNQAIELDPNYAPAYFQRGVLYYTMSQRENALADFEHYLELAPDGLYAEEAAQYIESIQIELESLGG